MSGGAYEYMASYMDGQLGNSGFTSDSITKYEKEYFDKYSNTSTMNSYNNRILGDATGEFGPFYRYSDGDDLVRNHNSWYSDSSHFVDSNNPWFSHGGGSYLGVLAGYYFNRHTGEAIGTMGSRLVLTK